MNTKLIRVLPAAAVLAAVAAVSASTGAVAGALITGADIKNGSVASTDIRDRTITGKDVKNRALTAADLSAATVAKFKGGSGPAGISGRSAWRTPKTSLPAQPGTWLLPAPRDRRFSALLRIGQPAWSRRPRGSTRA